MKTKKSIESSISNTESTSYPLYNIQAYVGNGGQEVSNDGSPSKRHLTSRQDITYKGSKHHN